MKKRPLIFINMEDAHRYCRSRCANEECSKHITKTYKYQGVCRLSLLKNTPDCEGFISTRAKKEEGKNV